MKTLLIIVLVLSACLGFTQTRTFPKNGRLLFKAGAYSSKSTSYDIVKPTYIDPQLTVDSLHPAIGYLEVKKKGIILFKNSFPSSDADLAGVLAESSLIEICNIEHRATFGDMTRDISHEVWYTIELNGRQYYIDLQPVNFRFGTEYLPKDQHFSVFARNAGYDNYFDLGYPEHFRILVFDNKAKPKLAYDSGELAFENGSEFWGADNEGDLVVGITSKGLMFELVGIKQRYKAIWNGTKLVDVVVKDLP